MAEDPIEEDYRPHPPGSVAVARRALILSGVVCRAFLEDSKDEKGRLELVGDIHDWFDTLDLWPHLEAEEEEILRVELGKMPSGLHTRATWYSEGLRDSGLGPSTSRLPAARRPGGANFRH